jgi:hypothetical protein
VFWASFEGKPITSLTEFLEKSAAIAAFKVAPNSTFVWRGASSNGWGLFSSLYRTLIERLGSASAITEDLMLCAERTIIQEARRWNLDWNADGGRLTGLELLAHLQHFGVPTRLLDFSFNASVALWFAVEKGADDGRVVAIDVGDHAIPVNNTQQLEPQWPTLDWTHRAWFWRPPPFEDRFVRQNGCFVVGGVPDSRHVAGSYRCKNEKGRAVKSLDVAQLRRITSIPAQFVHRAHATGESIRGKAPTRYPAFTLRIDGSRKAEIRDELKALFGLDHSTIYPDIQGFADHAGFGSQRW